MTYILKGSVAASLMAAMLATSEISHAQDFTIDFGGRHMLDYAFADISGPDSKIRDEEIRRLRGKVSGKLGSKWSYKVETTIDTESDGFNLILEDAYVQFKPGIGNWAFIFGQDNTTVSMLEQESSLHSGTYERAAFTDAFGFSRRLGVVAKTKGYKGNKFTRPKVDKPFGQGGLGALSFIAHYDNLDLQDAVYTGKLDTFALGADWWPTSKTRLGVNYFNADAENGSADKGEGIVARAQFEF
ncbi:porin [Hellea balneolensis]|uniref:porin n=1 Tax=Hellea balneolensis TaxID=287478 RepID=UPI0003FDE3D3|nr:porin [Hellea balneolensis]